MTLPVWLQALPDADQQRAIDSWAINQLGIPGEVLMERAGAGLARAVLEALDGHSTGPIVVVCGKGNNGGDGLVAARLLRDAGHLVRVLMLGDPAELQGDALANLRRLPGPDPEAFSVAALGGAAAIVDAILGTGFSGTPREPAAGAIAAINQAGSGGALVVACDIPSGVDGSSGEVAGVAVRADLTVTFDAAKPGLWINPGKTSAGRVVVVDIGIPAGKSGIEPEVGLIGDAVLAEIPRRGADSTKFSAGAVLVCGGSAGLSGAPSMASMSAMRAGAGYVTVAAPESLTHVLGAKLLEVMSVALPERDGELDTEAAVKLVLERVERVQSVVLGPGLGRADGARWFAREVAAQASVPLLLDADGLNAHAGDAGVLAERDAATVLTPHAGELGRLLGISSKDVADHRLARAREAVELSRAVVVLKGDDTIVASPDGRVAISPGGAPVLATAGTGDVLSGIIGAHLAKGMDPFTAACAGVLVHVRAGQLAAGEIGPEGVIASDVIAQVPRALRDGELEIGMQSLEGDA
jgi:ADP-dependent NAD(P)H-hydrate dehydratase / NAD(P)H-hydrate epimerase